MGEGGQLSPLRVRQRGRASGAAAARRAPVTAGEHCGLAWFQKFCEAEAAYAPEVMLSYASVSSALMTAVGTALLRGSA